MNPGSPGADTGEARRRRGEKQAAPHSDATITEAVSTRRRVVITAVELYAKLQRLSIPPTAVRVAVLVILGAGFAFASPFFLRPANLLNIATNVAVAGIIACPLTLLLVARQIDLSVGSAAAFAGIVLALAAPEYGLGVAAAFAVVAAVLVAVINGFSVTVIGINSIIATLATLAAFRGFARLLAGGQTIRVDGFGFIGAGRVSVGPLEVPVPVILLIIVAASFALVLRYTRYGRHIYAIGANPQAARLAGIPVRRHVFVGFLLAGAGVALAGMILVSQVGAALPIAGTGLELLVITGIILGGASLAGGRGTIAGTISAILILGVLDNGLTLMRVQSAWQEVARGALLLAAVGFDQIRIRVNQLESETLL